MHGAVIPFLLSGVGIETRKHLHFQREQHSPWYPGTEVRAGECSSAGQLDSRLTLLAVKSAALTRQKVLRVEDLKMKNYVGKTKIYMMDAGKHHGEQYKNINKQEFGFCCCCCCWGFLFVCSLCSAK